MKIDNIFDGDIFDSRGKIEKGEKGIEVSDEDGQALIDCNQACTHKPAVTTEAKTEEKVVVGGTKGTGKIGSVRVG